MLHGLMAIFVIYGPKALGTLFRYGYYGSHHPWKRHQFTYAV